MAVLSAKTWLFTLLALVAAGFLVVWVRRVLAARRAGTQRVEAPGPLEVAIGFVTNFFDTLGIGSFAPTTSVFKLKGLVPDENIPGTLNVGHTVPVVAQAFIYVAIIQADMTTLITLIVSAVLGGWLGAGVVSRWPRRNIQLGMGLGLLIMGGFFVLQNLDEMRGSPVIPGGDAIGLDGVWLVVAAAGIFGLGALLTLGIGLYAPCLLMISLLGMNPRVAFPIMMGACAFLMPVASARFVQAERYSLRPALGLALGGLPAVLIAAFLVKSLSLTAVRWLVVVVVLYTAVTMLRSARRARAPAP